MKPRRAMDPALASTSTTTTEAGGREGSASPVQEVVGDNGSTGEAHRQLDSSGPENKPRIALEDLFPPIQLPRSEPKLPSVLHIAEPVPKPKGIRLPNSGGGPSILGQGQWAASIGFRMSLDADMKPGGEYELTVEGRVPFLGKVEGTVRFDEEGRSRSTVDDVLDKARDI